MVTADVSLPELNGGNCEKLIIRSVLDVLDFSRIIVILILIVQEIL